LAPLTSQALAAQNTPVPARGQCSPGQQPVRVGHDPSWWLLPEVVRETANVIGLSLALKLSGSVYGSRVARSSGRFGTIYIPEKPRGSSFDRLVSIIGDDGASKLVAALGGAELRFGSCAAWSNRVRDASVRQYWRDSNLTVAWIGWLHMLTDRQVRNICKGEPRLGRRNTEIA